MAIPRDPFDLLVAAAGIRTMSVRLTLAACAPGYDRGMAVHRGSLGHVRAVATSPRALVGAAKGVVARGVDRLYGISTIDQVAAADLGYGDGSGYLHYQASSWLSVPGVFAGWAPPPGPGDVIVDLGCGKGRALVQMGRAFAVDRLVGVEFDERLAAYARDNLTRTGSNLRATDWRVEVADARTFEIPDDTTVVYVANPFDGVVFRDAMARVVESFDRRPRRLRIAYVHPTEAGELVAGERFHELPQPKAWWMAPLGVDRAEFRVFEVVAAP